ncbi:MAG TPA: SCO family protein [Geomonas sp.]|nr:SCO family protein [Geomonas sp.]
MMDNEGAVTKRVYPGCVLVLVAAVLTVPFLPCTGNCHQAGDEVFRQVAVVERLGGRLPGQLSFTDQPGKEVHLSRYFTGGPVILTLNYYSCPTLCPLLFKNLAGSIAALRNLKPGSDFKIVTVSIDPQETAQRASEKSAKTYAMLEGVKEPAKAWPYLRGSEKEIATLADSVGVACASLLSGCALLFACRHFMAGVANYRAAFRCSIAYLLILFALIIIDLGT